MDFTDEIAIRGIDADTVFLRISPAHAAPYVAVHVRTPSVKPGGGPGWSAAMKNENIKAIVAFEPGSNFVFPAGEVPDPHSRRTSLHKMPGACASQWLGCGETRSISTAAT